MDAFSPKCLVKCKNGCVASSQELATDVGVKILESGGNAADSAVAVAAVLGVMEPCSTGLGGDAFCLYYDKKSNTVKGLNASGRSPFGLNLEMLNKLGYDEGQKPPVRSPLMVTVPGSCAGWTECVEKFGSGRLSLMEILQLAINLARNGFKMTGPITAEAWSSSVQILSDPKNKYGKELLIQDVEANFFKAPSVGDTFQNPGLAKVMESIGQNGKDGFYSGWVAESIVNTILAMGGVMTMEDLKQNQPNIVEPLSINYKGYRLWEIPPNGQGVVALLALNILKNFDFSNMNHNSAEYLHLLIEAFRLSFSDVTKHCGDPEFSDVPISKWLDPIHGKMLAARIKTDKAFDDVEIDKSVSTHGDTVYFTTADMEGNFCSFINSNYMGFGTGIVPQGCGFSLQNRGYNFSLTPGHPNCVAPNKRPFHTIIPAMLTDDHTGKLLMSFGVMGGFMQPQGHVQVLLNMTEFGMDPQEALDAPRFLLGAGHTSYVGDVNIETGVSEEIIESLRKLGHGVKGPVDGFARQIFGRGQIIARKQFWAKSDACEKEFEFLWAGSDTRADGKASGY